MNTSPSFAAIDTATLKPLSTSSKLPPINTYLYTLRRFIPAISCAISSVYPTGIKSPFSILLATLLISAKSAKVLGSSPVIRLFFIPLSLSSSDSTLPFNSLHLDFIFSLISSILPYGTAVWNSIVLSPNLQSPLPFTFSSGSISGFFILIEHT